MKNMIEVTKSINYTPNIKKAALNKLSSLINYYAHTTMLMRCGICQDSDIFDHGETVERVYNATINLVHREIVERAHNAMIGFVQELIQQAFDEGRK